MMKVSVMLLASVAIISSVGCVNASGKVVLGLESDSGSPFYCIYSYGYRGRTSFYGSDGGKNKNERLYNGIGELACDLNRATDGALFAESGCDDLFGESDDYSIVGNAGACHDVLVFSGFSCNRSMLESITFEGGSRSKPSVKLVGDSADNLQLPDVICRNIPMFHLDVDCPGLCKPSMRSFTTNAKTGLEYNYPIVIGVKNCNNAGADICIVAKPGTCNFYYPNKNGNNERIGITAVYIPGLSESLETCGLYVSGIEVSAHSGYRTVKLSDDLCINDICSLVIKNRSGLSIDMGGDKQRFKRKVMKRHFSQYQPVWDDRTNDPNRRFLNISVE